VATPREIRRRIRSVRNTSQITRAMEMVAASKMRRAQQQVTASRPYSDRLRLMIGDLAAITVSDEERSLFPLLERRPVRRSLVVLITADRGLAGAFNSNLIRRGLMFMRERPEGFENIDVIAVGRKGRDYMTRLRQPLVAEFTQMPDRLSLDDVRPIIQVASADFVEQKIDAVYIVYTQFVNTLRQHPEVRQILPIEPQEETGEVRDYIFEPDPAVVLEALLPRYIEVQIYQAMLESIASEHSARMVAMRNATDNAKEILTDLELTYNKARQAQITAEVAEIATGAVALEG
jgi:F-type H+-transporting ATPase subunit gamma